MKYLALALLFCGLMSSARAQCYSKDMPEGQTSCQDDVDQSWHEAGSHWRNSNCMDCTCTECCAAYSTPTGYPDDCVAEFDKDNCKYNVHKKDDPNVSCPVSSAVGK